MGQSNVMQVSSQDYEAFCIYEYYYFLFLENDNFLGLFQLFPSTCALHSGSILALDSTASGETPALFASLLVRYPAITFKVSLLKFEIK